MRARTARVTAALAVLAASASAQVRLSQIYGGGGNLGAPYLSDYVELHNSGAPQSLAGWSVQYASATGATWLVTPLPAITLPSGGYFLVRQSDGTSTGPGQALALPTPDANGPGGGIAMSATDAKIALCNSATALVGATPTSAAIVDFVGYGTLANWREPFSGGTSADNAPVPSNALALFRRGCGASDTNDNDADWSVGSPMPRNLATPPANGVSAIGLANPYLAEPMQSVRLTVTPFSCASDAPLFNASVSVDSSAIGGGASVALLDDGTNGDEIASDGVFSRTATIAAGTGASSLSLPFVVTGGAQSGGGYLGLIVTPSTSPDNDSCATAIALSGLFPIAINGDLTGANVEYDPLVAVTTPNAPPGGQGARRGLWYSIVGNGDTLTADTCASPLIGSATIPDTVLGVFAGTCDGLTLIAMNDDNPTMCGAGSGTERRSRASWCSEAGATYFVWVASFSAGPQTFSFTLTLSDGGACSGATPASVCTLTFPAGTVDENEAGYGPATNDGCDSSPRRFTDIAATSPALVVRGSSRSYADRRDSDWYRFQAGVSGLLRVEVEFESQGTLELRQLSATGTCSTNTLVDTATAQRCETITLSRLVTAGEWYAVRIAAFNASPGTLGGIALGARSAFYRAEIELGGVPANDACGNALALTLGGGYVGGSTIGATNDGTSTCDPSGGDVWYAVTTTFVGTLNIDTCGSSGETVLGVYSSCGGAPLSCNDDCGSPGCGAPSSCLSLPTLAPGTYHVRVSNKGAPGTFRIRAALAIENDDCAGAIPIACGSMVSGTTIGAMNELGSVPATCPGPGAGTLGGSFQVSAPGVWYSLTLPGVAGIDDKTVYVDTLTASYDTRLSVFTGACGALACVTANDDVVGAPQFHSKVGWRATAGQTYFVLVHGFNIATGTFVLAVSCANPVANDACANAYAIGPYAGSLQGTTVGATGEPYDYPTGGANGMTSCAATDGSPSTFSYFDVWYVFAAQCDATVTMSTCGTLDTVLSVHTSCPSTSSSNALGQVCNNDGGLGCAPGSSLQLGLVYGQTYWIRVAQADAASSGGTFTLSWAFGDGDGDGADDCVDECPYDPNKSAPGQCGCGIADVDSDGDGAADCVDGCPTDPNKFAPGQCGCGSPDTDTDGDGTADCHDGCPTDPAKVLPGVCGCGIADVDSDGDGTPNCIDGCPNDPNKVTPGACGCGLADVDSDGDGVLDCFDGCPLDPDKIARGQCGCGQPDTDTDNDGTADCHDGCPTDPTKIAPGACGCGVADTDTDSDGVADCNDNCVALANPAQADCDMDGVGDVCELAAGTSPDQNGNAIPDECEYGALITYCTAGTSSHGCAASVGASGVPSASATSGFVLQASGVEGQKAAMFFYGVRGPLMDPWGTSSSLLCVKAPTQRTITQNSGGVTATCTGTIAFDWSAFIAANPNSLGTTFSAGDLVWTQLWYRDPAAVKTTALSNGLQFTLAP